MDWSDIKAIDSQLEVFDRELSRFRNSLAQEPDWRIYEVFKKWVSEHVGWNVRDKRLRSIEAYDVALKHICEVLGI